MTYDYYLVIDLEATCDDRGAVPKPEMEIIEIGAVLADATTLEAVEEFQTFVRPVRHPRLTEFCIGLTHITQAMVDAAPRFPQAIAALREFIGGRSILFGSWGAYDNNQFRLDAALHGVELPLGNAHINLKQEFSRRLGTKKRFGMASALKKVGLPLVGTHHRGIDDARNITRLLPHCTSPGVG